MGDQILKPDHPRWIEFIERLEGPEGCNFRFDENMKHIWHCSQTLKFTGNIVRRMGEFDVQATLELFKEHGGHCDCEVVFNVEESFWVANMDDYYRESLDSTRCPNCEEKMGGNTIFLCPKAKRIASEVEASTLCTICRGCAKEFTLAELGVKELLDSEFLE